VNDLVQMVGDAEDDPSKGAARCPAKLWDQDQRMNEKKTTTSGEWKSLPAHGFAMRESWREESRREESRNQNPDLWMYRNRTTALLRRYMRLSLEAGRLPSVIGREFFRAKVTSYKSATFEDRVIFVHDVEVCLDRLNDFDRKLIARVVLQEHDHERAARLLHCTRKTIERRLPELLDELSEQLLRVRLLEPVPTVDEEDIETRAE
jgi:DNA-directed RNA polymerase specialized sigma24 family protein